MNKYVLRTSLVWAVALACAAGAYFYFARGPHRAASADSSVQPAAVGSAKPQPGASASEESPLAPIELSPQRAQSIGVQTGIVKREEVTGEIRATGVVQIDERLVSYVQVRFSGYIRRVFANATYQRVIKGQPLFTIYSPELVATQNEYLLARQNESLLKNSDVGDVASSAAALTAAAKARLAQWNIPQAELATLDKTGKPVPELTIDSPASGYITQFSALPNLYVQPSTRLYTIADLAHVWVNAQLSQDDAGRIRPGDGAVITVDAYPGRSFRGRVEMILPQVDQATRAVQARLDIANPGLQLKPGMYVNVDLTSNLGRHLIVPASAVLQSGTQAVAFIDRGEGRLVPQDVTLGPRVGDNFIVLTGLKAGQHVVTSANFLIDSDSQLQAAAGSYTPPAPGAGRVAQPTQSQLQLTFTPNPPRKGSNKLLVKLIAPDRKPIEDAQVTVLFFMPSMPAMGMSAKSVSAKLADSGRGSYKGAVGLPSGGTWQVTITAQKSGRTVATKALSVNAAGAM